MKKSLSFILLVAVSLLTPRAAHAWGAPGHEVVARIAWENMTPKARQKVVLLLSQAPTDACLLSLIPPTSLPTDERARGFFVRAATWPDVVRPMGHDDTRVCTKYNHPPWHFINFFWSGVSGDPTKPPHELATPAVPPLNAVERLQLLRGAGLTGIDASRAIQIAWILHLVGDIHQPLHTSARVTNVEPDGDEGGNTFLLGNGQHPPKLHAFWDHIIDDSIPRKAGEDEFAYVDRVAGMIMQSHPRATLASELKDDQFMDWAREGLATSESSAYPKTLKRGQAPSVAYRKQALILAGKAIALGGYRLADLLNELFDS